MYIEDQYIYEQFRDNFIENFSGKIIIYGTGLYTQRLLEKLPLGCVSGLMDAKRTGENLWGYKVLSYEEVAALGDVSIVVIARNAVIHVIYRRIESFCQQNGIKVYDVNGNELGNMDFQNISHPCFVQKEEELRAEILKYQVITFDIFDTLLVRNVYRPRDIFGVIDKLTENLPFVFSKMRVAAEDSFAVGENPSVEEIYDKLQELTGIDQKTKTSLKEKEINLEKRFLHRREKMCELFEFAMNEGKSVYLISDMYFGKEILEAILLGCGISGFKTIYISCEEKLAKQEGLFDRFLEKEGCRAEDCLHIGDNFYSDILAAKKAGMSAFQIYSPRDMLENGVYSGAISECNSIEESIVLGKFAREAYENPFGAYDERGRVVVSEAQKVAGLFVAPVITKYMCWLSNNVQEDGTELVVFPSRDGFLLMRLYEKLMQDKKLPPAIYLYTSRRAALAAATKTEKDIACVMDFSHGKDWADLLKSRFGIEKVVPKEEATEVILEACKAERKAYVEYLEEVGIGKFDKIAFVDFMAMGTVQEALQRVMDKKFKGYYFLRRMVEKVYLAHLDVESLYQPKGDFEMNANIYRFYYFLENVISSYEPTFMRISQSGDKQFYQETRTKEAIAVVRELHKGIMEYAEEVLPLLVMIDGQEAVSLYDKLLGFFSREYSDVDKGVCEAFENVDEFMGRVVQDFNR